MASETPKGPSARLLTMKFMQRAAASASSNAPAEMEKNSPSAKKRKISHSTGEQRYNVDIDQAAIRAVMEEEEAKRLAALAKHSGADTHWVLKAPRKSGKAQKVNKQPLNIVYVGYGDIDSSAEPEATEGVSNAGRTSTTNYKKSQKGSKTTRKDEEEEDASASSSDDSEDESSGQQHDNARDASAAGNARKAKARAGSNSRQDAELARAKEFRDKRKKKEVKVGKITSISSAGNSSFSPGRGAKGSSAMTCYKCQQPGHKAADCPK